MSFCDLGLSDKFDPKGLPALRDMGYRTVAFDLRVRECNSAPEPPIRPQVEGMTVLNRITVEFAGADIAHKLARCPNLRKYDILAVAPSTAAAMQHACSIADVDIVSCPAADSNPIRPHRKTYRQAVERGVHFELPYSSALADSARRTTLIKRAHAYISVGKSANVLLSSGAENIFQTRGPRDLINLGLVLGFSEECSKRILTTNAKKVLLKSDNRRRGKVPIFVLDKLNRNKRPFHTEDPSPSKKLKLS